MLLTTRVRLALGVCSMLVLSACGSSGDSPTAPSQPTVNLSITGGSDAILTGQTTSFGVSVTVNGTAQAVTPTWTSDSGAASVDTGGRVTGMKHGRATISASYQGAVARQTIAVTQNYGGTWSGDYSINRCDASRDFAEAGFCGVFKTGSTLPMRLSLSQTRESVSGQITFGQVGGGFNGSVGGGGTLSASGSVPNGVFTFAVGGFNGSVEGTHLTANWAENITASGWTGNGYLELATRTVTQTSSAASSLSLRQRTFSSPQDMWRAMFER